MNAAASMPFDPTTPLPEGVTVLEASAGTGKTHAVVSIVLTEVAEGRPLDELLVVTFTRKATGTLRERVWRRLTDAVVALAPEADASTDSLFVHLRRGDPEEVALRRKRLTTAASDFDAATIATTHGFCRQVLAGLGVAGDAERDLEVVDSVGDLVRDAVDDLLIRRFHNGEIAVSLTRGDALAIASVVVKNLDAKIALVEDDEALRLRRRFAMTLRARIEDQKRRGRLVTYDDLLTRLVASVDDPIRGAVVAERLRRRYSMAIVDEFQDTDTVQWRILQSAFGSAPGRLILVGDPKQAVYAFRGGDVHAYLHATKGANLRTLDVSWRSDQPLIDALDAFFAGAQLGAPSIVHRPLKARPGAETSRLVGPQVAAPLTVRVVDRNDGEITRTKTGLAEKSSTRRFIARDVAAEAVRLLSSGTTIVERNADGAACGSRPLCAADLAVLVRTNRDAETVRTAFVDAGVAAVAHGGASVFTTAAACHWLELLQAIEQPSYNAKLRAVVLGPFFGWDAEQLAIAGEEHWDHVDDALHSWIAALRRYGIAGLLRRIELTEGLTERVLGQVGGERVLSDLHHVAELVDGWQAAHPSSVAVLIGWLSDQIAEAAHDFDSARRRLESDSAAVAIHTIHGAKGLEFPVVFLPSLWEGPWVADDELPVFHDEEGIRSVGVAGRGARHDHQRLMARKEAEDEELRLLYVALTRARHQVVVWWATASDARSSAFARVLLGRDRATGAIVAELFDTPTETDIRAALAELGASTNGSVAALPATGARAKRPIAAFAPRDLDVSVFDRGFDESWTRTSYSGLTEAAHDAGHHASAEVDEAATVDEPEFDSNDPTGAGTAELAAALALGVVPGGARVGTMVHELLEEIDFTTLDLPAAVVAAAARVGAVRLVPGQVDVLVDGLVDALRTPLGPVFDNRCLAQLDQHDRLDELAFDLPLAGGDRPDGFVTMASIADVFASCLPADDPLADYHERLRNPLIATSVRGFLSGSIDLVARVKGRHIVVDYKTNRLAPADETLVAWHYRPEAMAAAMADAHYPLQAALYSVALHRYLRWRIAAYDPERHLGGMAYLFLRGMSGPDVPVVDGQPCGVFGWRPPTEFVVRLSDLLDRGAP